MIQTILIGTGQMAVDYSMVLRTQKVPFTVVGRGAESAKLFESKTGISPTIGGIEEYLRESESKTSFHAIIAVGPEQLLKVLQVLDKDKRVVKVLIEKPAALSIDEFTAMENLDYVLDKTHVGYNRRFYASTLKAEEIIKEDGGLTSVHFEFTEWSHKITPSPKPLEVKENWFLANSTHVVDLAFFLAGLPAHWQAYQKEGNLPWHKVSVFAGAGITKENIIFSYHANWESAGRWSIELLTAKNRLYLRPMESLQIQALGTLDLKDVSLDLALEKEFKPGLYKQVEAFYEDTANLRCLTLSQQIENVRNIYSKMIH